MRPEARDTFASPRQLERQLERGGCPLLGCLSSGALPWGSLWNGLSSGCSPLLQHTPQNTSFSLTPRPSMPCGHLGKGVGFPVPSMSQSLTLYLSSPTCVSAIQPFRTLSPAWSKESSDVAALGLPSGKPGADTVCPDLGRVPCLPASRAPPSLLSLDPIGPGQASFWAFLTPVPSVPSPPQEQPQPRFYS